MLAGIFVGRLGDEEDEKIAIFSQLRLRDLNTNFNKIKQLENNGPCFPEKRKGWVTEQCGSCLTRLPQRQQDKEGGACRSRRGREQSPSLEERKVENTEQERSTRD